MNTSLWPKPLWYLTWFFFCATILSASSINLPSGVTVNLDAKEVKIPLIYVGDGSGLEFIVTKGMDKDYESLFSSNVSGKDLHMALLMIGLDKAEPAASDNTQATPSSPTLGSPVEAMVQFDGGEKPIENFLQWSDDRDVDDLKLHFKGSRFLGRGAHRDYAADLSLNLLGAWPDSDMVIGPNVTVGNPYVEGDPPFLRPSSKLKLQHHQRATLVLRKAP